MAKTRREVLRDEILDKVQVGITDRDVTISRKMLEFGLITLKLDTKDRRPVFMEQLRKECEEAEKDGIGKAQVLENMCSAFLFFFTEGGLEDWDRGNAVSKKAADLLFHVLSGTADELAEGNRGDLRCAIRIRKFIETVIRCRWEEAGEISPSNMYMYESNAASLAEIIQDDLERETDAHEYAAGCLRTAESFPDEGNPYRNCFLGYLSWNTGLLWNHFEPENRKKVQRCMRRTVRYLQNMEETPFTDETDDSEMIIGMAMAVIEGK